MSVNEVGGTRTYVLGHSDHELVRLEKQAAIFADATEDTLQRAGLRPGMRVLDIGCGVGDVALIAARMVGPKGSVVAIDRAKEAISVARRRAASHGLAQIQFETGDLHSMRFDEPFDALTGRFILMYLTDPSAVIRRLAGFLKPGSPVAFVEMDIDAAGAVPPMPLLKLCVDWITSTYRSVGIEPNMGSKLYAAFRGAGLSPEMAGSCRLEGGVDAVVYEFAAETLRSLVPRMVEFGIATPAEVGIDTLAERLRRESVAGDHCVIFPRVVGAWARTA